MELKAWLLLLFSVFCFCATTVVKDSGLVTKVLENDPSVVICGVPGSSDLQRVTVYTWLYPNQSVVKHDVYQFLLQLKRPQLEDSGNYTCIANYAVDGKNSTMNRTFEIKVIEEFQWLNCPTNQYLKLGAINQSLECVVPHSYRDELVWTKNGQNLTPDVYTRRNFSLVITGNASDDNVGIYNVFVQYEPLKVNKSREIQVELSTLPEIVVPNVTDWRVEKKTPFIVCNATGKPEPHYDWFDGIRRNLSTEIEEYEVNRATGRLRLKQLPGYNELLTCVAENENGKVNKTVNVTIYEELNIISFENKMAVVGSEVTFKCDVTGSPEPHIEFGRIYGFIHNGTKEHLQNGTDILHLRDVRTDDEGPYYCNASNGFETKERVALLSVEYPPRIKTEKEEIVLCSEPVKLVCKVDANPRSNVVWHKDGSTLLSNDTYILVENANNYVLSVNYTRKRDVIGEYNCNATNAHGSNCSKITIVRPNKVSPPHHVEIITTTTSSITLNIQRPVESCVAVEAVAIMSPQHARTPIPMIKFSWTDTSAFVLSDLKPNTEYSILAAFVDEYEDVSEYSNEVIAHTEKVDVAVSVVVIYVAVAVVIILFDIGLFIRFKFGLTFWTFKFCRSTFDVTRARILFSRRTLEEDPRSGIEVECIEQQTRNQTNDTHECDIYVSSARL